MSNLSHQDWETVTLKKTIKQNKTTNTPPKKIPTVVYYPKALTQQNGYSLFPIVSTGVTVSEHLAEKVLSLPMHPYLCEQDIQDVVQAIIEKL